jgi:hypothetical protein
MGPWIKGGGAIISPRVNRVLRKLYGIAYAPSSSDSVLTLTYGGMSLMYKYYARCFGRLSLPECNSRTIALGAGAG